MTPEQYEAWYSTPRGRWIADAEYRLLREAQSATAGSSVLDVGCGTGHFSRRLVQDGFIVTGIDADVDMIRYAAAQGGDVIYRIADACALPFPDHSFDAVVAITSLCFIREQQRAVAEMLRVARSRIALGLLNRHSLLYQLKGRRGGSGAYRGAQWHTVREARRLLSECNAHKIAVRSAIFVPGGGAMARVLENTIPSRLPLGGFLLATGIPTRSISESQRSHQCE